MEFEVDNKEALGKWSSSEYALFERQGVKWWCGSHGNLPETVADRRKPYLIGKAQFIDEFPNGDFVIANQSGFITKMDRDYEVKWEWGRGTLGNSANNAAVVNWDNGRILVSDPANDRILEYDPATDSVTLTLDTFSGVGGMTTPRANYAMETGKYRPYPSYSGNINVADHPNHYVAVVDRDGNVLHSFGTYGTAGDGTNLNHPMWLFSGGNGHYFISDQRNNRVIRGTDMDADGIDFLLAWTLPSCFDKGGRRYALTGNHMHSAHNTGDGLIGFAPFVSESCIRNSFQEGVGGLSALGTFHGSAWEYDLRSAAQVMRPMIWPNSVGEAADTNLYVVPMLAFNRAVVQALSTDADTLTIYSLKTRGGNSEMPHEADPDASGNLQWQEYDSVDLTADTLESYILSNPAGVMAVQVTGTGTVDLRCHLEP